MRWLGVILGVIFLLVGLLWIGQGLILVPGSFMTGQPAYAMLGLVVAVLGLGLLYATLRPARTRRS